MAAMSASGDHAASEVLRGLSRHLNRLNEDDRAARQRALEAIRKDTLDKSLPGVVLQEVLGALLRPLLRCLSDPVDRCREGAVDAIRELILRVPEPEQALPSLVPCLAQRLGGRELLEPSEELRLSAVELLRLTVELCGRRCGPYVDDVTTVLRRTIVDPCPEVKKESCRCAVSFAESVPGGWRLCPLPWLPHAWSCACGGCEPTHTHTSCSRLLHRCGVRST